jgi:hypothetical protein
MKVLLATALLFSVTSFAGQNRQLMTCDASAVNGQKPSLSLQVYVLNAHELEEMKIQFKNQILVNELNPVEGVPYNDGIINNHVAFVPKSDSDLAIVLPVNFQLMKTIAGFLSQQKGDDVSFTALDCNIQ